MITDPFSRDVLIFLLIYFVLAALSFGAWVAYHEEKRRATLSDEEREEERNRDLAEMQLW
jgi:hypothetical protein